MSIIAALTKKWNYSVESPGVGRLAYREGNREYTFPLYEDEGVLVLVGVPSSQQIHFFFNWHPLFARELSSAARERILPRILDFLRGTGAKAILFDRTGQRGRDFEFYPELLEYQTVASELLEEAGYIWFKDFSSIEIVQEDYGLEISGMRNERDGRRVLKALQQGFPHWHHYKVSQQDYGREQGWMVAISMLPPRPCNSGSYDGD
ncbi:MAG: hypothetical protein JWR26_3301 [Pedosphaera sp.]|nr:hypothetical protein [Pedosphaera sp.]